MLSIIKPIEIKEIEKQTPINCFFAVYHSKGEYIKYIKNPSENLIKLALRINGMNIRFIPEEMKTIEVCKLAAIHGATLSVLPNVDDETRNIVEYLAHCLAPIKDDGRYHKPVPNFPINGEMTNLSNKPSSMLIEDIPEFIDFAIDLSLVMPKRLAGPVLFIGDKVISFNQTHRGRFHKEIPLVKPINEGILYIGERLNTSYLKKIVVQKPGVVFEIKPEDVTPNLVAMAIKHGLPPKDWGAIPKEHSATISKAASLLFQGYSLYGKKEKVREILRAVSEINGGNLPDIIVESILDHSSHNSVMLTEDLIPGQKYLQHVRKCITQHKRYNHYVSEDLFFEEGIYVGRGVDFLISALEITPVALRQAPKHLKREICYSTEGFAGVISFIEHIFDRSKNPFNHAVPSDLEGFEFDLFPQSARSRIAGVIKKSGNPQVFREVLKKLEA